MSKRASSKVLRWQAHISALYTHKQEGMGKQQKIRRYHNWPQDREKGKSQSKDTEAPEARIASLASEINFVAELPVVILMSTLCVIVGRGGRQLLQQSVNVLVWPRSVLLQF